MSSDQCAFQLILKGTLTLRSHYSEETFAQDDLLLNAVFASLQIRRG